ncbi:MAG: Ribosomal RNA small subunit methyltransferase G [candidate division BRC1 bacterium ADurb.BinA364]|nr:MAG: Ribosomal RNA small subunit methyltransferase G [candidate division BRC1 bacterium ADurb.BinA364]
MPVHETAPSAAAGAFAAVLREALAAARLALRPEAEASLAQHFALVLEANRRLNLTAIVEPREAAAKHCADSLAALLALDEAGGEGRAIDVGSGAGYPGIPLAVARPGWHWTVLDSKEKKARFLEFAIAELGLRNTRAQAGRAETLAQAAPWRDSFDAAIGRAIAPLGAVAEILLPFVRPGGTAIAMKGPSERIDAGAREALRRLGGGEPRSIEYALPFELGRRSLIVIPKIAPTPKGFPRRPGMAAKHPLF